MTNPTTTNTKHPNRRKLLIADILERAAYEIQEFLAHTPGNLPAKRLNEIADKVLAHTQNMMDGWTMFDFRSDCALLTRIHEAVQAAERLGNPQIAQEAHLDVQHRAKRTGPSRRNVCGKTEGRP